mgnify:CR=1 FL=1
MGVDLGGRRIIKKKMKEKTHRTVVLTLVQAQSHSHADHKPIHKELREVAMSVRRH